MIKKFYNSCCEVDKAVDKMEDICDELYGKIYVENNKCVKDMSHNADIIGWIDIRLKRESTIADLRMILKSIKSVC